MKKFLIDGKTYNKGEINKLLKAWVWENPPFPLRVCDQTVAKEVQDFIRAYCALGPRKDLAVVDEIKKRWWDKLHQGPRGITPVFVFVDFNGVEQPVGYLKFQDDDETSRYKFYQEEMRNLIMDQTTPPRKGLEMDHVWPWTFKFLCEIFWFIRDEKYDVAEGDWREDWKKFHKKYARLEPVTPEEHKARTSRQASQEELAWA